VVRLYSWIDYQRLCVISSLLSQGVPTQRVRVAAEYLDDVFPSWYELALTPWHGEIAVPGAAGVTHVALTQQAFKVIADAAGQMTYRELLGDDWQDSLPEAIATSLEDVTARGSLYQLSKYRDAVEMNPQINVGLPTLCGTSLETGFLYGLVKISSVTEVAKLYRLNPDRVARAVEFQEDAA
jgi:hypothetical protein